MARAQHEVETFEMTEQSEPAPAQSLRDKFNELNRTFIKRHGSEERTFTVTLANGASPVALDFAGRASYVPSQDLRERAEHTRSVLELAARQIMRELGSAQGVWPADPDDWKDEHKALFQGAVDDLLSNAGETKDDAGNVISVADKYAERIASVAADLVASYVPLRRERKASTKKAEAVKIAVTL